MLMPMISTGASSQESGVFSRFVESGVFSRGIGLESEAFSKLTQEWGFLPSVLEGSLCHTQNTSRDKKIFKAKGI